MQGIIINKGFPNLCGEDIHIFGPRASLREAHGRVLAHSTVRLLRRTAARRVGALIAMTGVSARVALIS